MLLFDKTSTSNDSEFDVSVCSLVSRFALLLGLPTALVGELLALLGEPEFLRFFSLLLLDFRDRFRGEAVDFFLVLPAISQQIGTIWLIDSNPCNVSQCTS